jgi:hypothetical protein
VTPRPGYVRLTFKFEGEGKVRVRDLFLIALVVMVPLVPCLAGEKWVQASVSSGSAVYYDEASVKKDGPYVLATVLNDFKEPVKDDKYTFHSMVTHQFVNCMNNVVQTTSIAYHSGNMASGDLLFSTDSIREMQKVVPGSVLSHLVDILCE